MLNQRGSAPIILGVFVLLLLVGIGAYYVITKQSISPPVVQQTPTISPLPTPTPLTRPVASIQIEEWKMMTLPTLGLRFKVPQKIADLGDAQEKFSKGDTGMMYCVKFIKKTALAPSDSDCRTIANPYLIIGTTSVDYTAGREGGFTDLEGFTYTEGKYFDNFVGNTPHLSFDQSRITKIENSNGVEIIKIAGKAEFDEGPSISNSLANNTGALINTKNSQYPGLAIIFETKQGLTQQEVDQILKTLEFVKP